MADALVEFDPQAVGWRNPLSQLLTNGGRTNPVAELDMQVVAFTITGPCAVVTELSDCVLLPWETV